MKILHLNTSDFDGGAARAAHRIHRALVNAGLDSRMLVLAKGTDDERVAGVAGLSRKAWIKRELLRRRQQWRARDWFTDDTGSHTFGWCSAGLVDELNASDADILNLHWVSDMLSIKDIGRLKKPIVWTLHDMWPMCGGEHYAADDVTARYCQGYRADNRPPGERGPDLNRQAWDAKRQAWARQRFTFVCPSEWMAGCVRKSRMFSDAKVAVIPNAIEVEHLWKPIDRDVARAVLNLPAGKQLILFGADRGVIDPRKGGDLLREMISRVMKKLSGEFELMIYGQGQASGGDEWPCPVHWLGVVRDDRLLVQAYSAADLVVVPSRQDNFPNTALESQACGTPVVAFDVGGLSDIIIHRKTGWLARKEDVEDLAGGVSWVLSENLQGRMLSAAARKYAVERFSEPVVAARYHELYRQVIG